MNIDRISPSSYNSWDGCQHRYFLEQNLKYRYPAGKAADKGTAVHTVMEILAYIKLQEQNDPSVRKVQFPPTTKKHTIDIDNYDINSLLDIALQSFKPGYFNATEISEMREHLNTATSFNGGEYDPRNRTIVAPEKRVQVPVPKDWAKINEKKQFTLSGIIDLVTEVDDNTYEVIDWKGLPTDTPILTTEGWSRMKNLKVGQYVFDKDGLKTRILGKSKIKHLPCYRIKFTDSTEISCDNEHLWYLDENTTLPITELRPGMQIPIARAVPHTHREKLPFNPYTLGLHLSGRFAVTDKETDTLNAAMIDYLEGMRLIPVEYTNASIFNRIQLLSGLCKSFNENKQYNKIITKSYNLYRTILRLLASLGFEFTCVYNEDKKNYTIQFDTQSISSQSDTKFKTIKSITPDLERETQCIMVDSPSSTYLCGQDLIVTHNTGQPKNFNTGKRKYYTDFFDDPQLRFYHWACSQLYGADKNYIVSIFFFKTLDCYSIPFGVDDLEKTEYLLRDRFNEIKDCSIPKLNRTFGCRRWCPFGTKDVRGTDFPNMIQQDAGGLGKIGEYMTICDCAHKLIHDVGIDFVEENYKKGSNKKKKKS